MIRAGDQEAAVPCAASAAKVILAGRVTSFRRNHWEAKPASTFANILKRLARPERSELRTFRTVSESEVRKACARGEKADKQRSG